MTKKKTAPPNASWWTNLPAGWDEAGPQAFAAWRAEQHDAATLNDEEAMSAMAFGYGARHHYADIETWELAADHVEQDWKAAGRSDAHVWSNPRSAIAAGWAANVRPAAGAVQVEATSPILEPLEAQVHGGRPDHPYVPNRRPSAVEEHQDVVPGGRLDGRRP